jgi:4-amino-4-deoxy-L-arabinose transferase-like glycosyltransferase
MSTLTLPAPPRPADGIDRQPPSPSRPRSDPGWVTPALIALLAATAVLYIWGLGASGWANSFYSAAVQAGTKSWKAFFFGSSDAAGSITVDKPPAALWVMELSARMFGVNAWSILVPQALEGVAAVGLLYATVKRWFGAAAGLLAGAVLALTPVAVLMFRFNNPDALLTLVLVGAAYAVTRALESGRTAWLVTAGALVGVGFLTKMLQALVVVPAFALAYLIAGPPRLGRRLWQLTLAGVALVVSSFWWVVVVMAIPAADRPYIGGSQNNSLWNLIFGYNGIGRVTGNETGSVVGGGAARGGSQWGPTGLTRLFNASFGGQASWLIPAALVLLAGGLAFTLRARRTDRTRAALIVWGGWLIVTGLVFSLSKGIIHPYYTVALAPAIGATIAIGAAAMWQRRSSWMARAVLAVAVAAGCIWSYVLLRRTPTWLPWLRDGELIAGLALAALIVAWGHLRARVAVAIAAAAAVVALSGPAAYSLATASTAHSGAIPSAGPSVAAAFGGPGGFGGGRGRPQFAGGLGRTTGGGGFGGFGGFGGAAAGGTAAGGSATGGTATGGTAGGTTAGGTAVGGGFPGGAPGGAGGLLDGSTPSAALTATLEKNASRYEWVAAAVGSNEAAGYQLATGRSVMPIGGFNGTDPSPTLAQFERLVAEGKIHYFIAGGGFGGGPGGGTSSTSSAIASWVESHFTSATVGGVTLYDLTSPVS